MTAIKPAPLRGKDLVEGLDDNLQLHEISTKQGNLDEQLHKISTSLIQEGNLDALYHRILDAAMVVMSSGMASMQLLDPERKQLRLLTWQGFHPQSAAFWEWVHFHSTTT